jgi:hypothetical protein
MCKRYDSLNVWRGTTHAALVRATEVESSTEANARVQSARGRSQGEHGALGQILLKKPTRLLSTTMGAFLLGTRRSDQVVIGTGAGDRRTSNERQIT